MRRIMMENETPTKERARKDDWTTDNKTRTIIHRVGLPLFNVTQD